jgi:KDO2-lipid IV(A) lauroyltransferase
MRIRHGLEYAAFRLLAWFVQIVPARLADATAVALGRLAYLILTSRRRIAADNLRRAFKQDITDDEITAITKKVFINISRSSIEFARFPVLTHRKILELVPDQTGMEQADKALAEGKGMICISGHFGSWELLGAWMCAKGYPVDYLVGQQHNRQVDRLLNRFRTSVGVGIIPVGVSARHVIKSLRANRLVGLVSDQHSASGAVVVDFFGRPAATPRGPAAFAVKMGCPIMLGVLIREKYNKHRAVNLPLIYPPRSGDTEKDIAWMTQEYTSQLESMIRKHPDHWMWTHRRWKLE